MNSTSLTLLQRVQSSKDSQAWATMLTVYQPLIWGWLRQRFIPQQEADDLTQEVLAVLLREIPNFNHNGQTGAFRAWLRNMTANRLRTHWRQGKARGTPVDVQSLAEQLEDSNSEMSQEWDRQHDLHVLGKLLEIMAQEFEPKTIEAFRQVALEGKKAEDVAPALDMSVVAVYIAKSRVLRRLREEAQGFMD